MSLKDDEIIGGYSHMAAKWSPEAKRYIPQGIRFTGPRDQDTLANRARYVAHLQTSNPYLKPESVIWYEPAVDEVQP